MAKFNIRALSKVTSPLRHWINYLSDNTGKLSKRYYRIDFMQAQKTWLWILFFFVAITISLMFALFFSISQAILLMRIKSLIGITSSSHHNQLASLTLSKRYPSDNHNEATSHSNPVVFVALSGASPPWVYCPWKVFFFFFFFLETGDKYDTSSTFSPSLL